MSKRKGTRNEHRSIRLLESAGIGSTDVVLVQVKTRDWPGSIEMETLREFIAPLNCRKLVHRWRDRQRLPDVKELQ